MDDTQGARDKRDVYARWALFVLATAAILFRYPDLATEPRIWGEEGSIYLRDAYAKPWEDTVLSPALGYFGLFSSVPTTIAAHFVQLEYVPLFLEAVGFVTQLCAVALVVWGHAPLWKNLAARALGLAILILNPLGEEVWLNTTCIQFHFVIVAFLLLLEPPEGLSVRARWTQRALVAVAGLAGPPPCTLSPLFVLRAFVSRTREAIVRAGILVVVAILQAIIVVHGMTSMVGRTERFGTGLDFSAVTTSAFGKSVVVPFLGVSLGTSFAEKIHDIEQLGASDYRLAGIVCAWLLVLVAYLFGKGAPLWDKVTYLGAAALLIVSSMVLGIGDRHTWVHPVCAARYYYAPGVIVMWFALSRLDPSRLGASTALQRGLAVALVVGLGFQLVESGSRIIPPSDNPHWRDEIAAHRRDPAHRLGIWPTGWSFAVPEKTR